jgi:hypothetical protein
MSVYCYDISKHCFELHKKGRKTKLKIDIILIILFFHCLSLPFSSPTPRLFFLLYNHHHYYLVFFVIACLFLFPFSLLGLIITVL